MRFRVKLKLLNMKRNLGSNKMLHKLEILSMTKESRTLFVALEMSFAQRNLTASGITESRHCLVHCFTTTNSLCRSTRNMCMTCKEIEEPPCSRYPCNLVYWVPFSQHRSVTAKHMLAKAIFENHQSCTIHFFNTMIPALRARLWNTWDHLLHIGDVDACPSNKRGYEVVYSRTCLTVQRTTGKKGTIN